MEDSLVFSFSQDILTPFKSTFTLCICMQLSGLGWYHWVSLKHVCTSKEGHNLRFSIGGLYIYCRNEWHKESFIKYVRKIFWKTYISNALIRTRTAANQGVRNVTSSEHFAYVFNGWPLIRVLPNIYDVFAKTRNSKKLKIS